MGVHGTDHVVRAKTAAVQVELETQEDLVSRWSRMATARVR